MPNDSTKKWTSHFLGMQTWHISLWWRPDDVPAASFDHKTFAWECSPAAVVCACCTVCCVYVAVRVFCLWFCSCHKVIKSMWHFYDIMTSRLKAERHPRRTKIIKQQTWSTPIAFVFTADSQQQQHQQQHRGTPWNMISNKKQIKDDKNRVSPHAVPFFRLRCRLVFSHFMRNRSDQRCL